jgi:hypothetical protein
MVRRQSVLLLWVLQPMILDVMVAQRNLPDHRNRIRDRHRVVVSVLLGQGCFLEEM